MFNRFVQAERAALAPLLELARSYCGYDRAHFLAELERDAPTVVIRLRRLLDEDEPQAHETTGAAVAPRPSGAGRVASLAGVSLGHVRTQTTAP